MCPDARRIEYLCSSNGIGLNFITKDLSSCDVARVPNTPRITATFDNIPLDTVAVEDAILNISSSI